MQPGGWWVQPSGWDLHGVVPPAPPWRTGSAYPDERWMQPSGWWVQPSGWDDACKNELGSMMIAYVNVEASANLEEVARDVRRHGPSIAIFKCESDAQLLSDILKRRPSAAETGARGGGDKAEKQYVCATHKCHVIAGRCGFVSSVELRDSADVRGGGTIAIAEVTLNVQVCNQMIFRVAAVNIADSELRGSGDDLGTAGVELTHWEQLREKLRLWLARFVAGEFGALVGLFLESLRGKMAADVVASSRYRVAGKPDDYIAGSFMFALGPIEKKTIIQDVRKTKPDNPFPKLLLVRALHLPSDVLGPSTVTRGSGGSEWTKGWPVIQMVKQKATSPLPSFKH